MKKFNVPLARVLGIAAFAITFVCGVNGRGVQLTPSAFASATATSSPTGSPTGYYGTYECLGTETLKSVTGTYQTINENKIATGNGKTNIVFNGTGTASFTSTSGAVTNVNNLTGNIVIDVVTGTFGAMGLTSPSTLTVGVMNYTVEGFGPLSEGTNGSGGSAVPYLSGEAIMYNIPGLTNCQWTINPPRE